MTFFTPLRQWIAAIATAGLATGGAADANAQTITNVANANWDAGNTRMSVPSNRVDIVVDRNSSGGGPLTIETYRFATPPGATQFAVPTTMCRGAQGTVPVELQGVFAGTPTAPASLEKISGIRANEPLVIAVNAPEENVNPNGIDSFELTLETPEGDREIITVTELEANGGRFVGMINTASIPPAMVRGDCRLSTRAGDQLKIFIKGQSSNAVLAEVDLEVLVDPFGETFDSGDGAIVDGTRITIVDAATGQPAQVFGDDGVSAFPSTIISGSRVTDASGAVYAFPAGFYRFPFLRQGTYRLVIEPPAPYTAPSTATPADLAEFRRDDGLPFEIVPGSYGRDIVLNGPAPVRVDIPLDRPGGALIVTKSVSDNIAVPGDALHYRIQVRNSDSRRSTGAVTVTDELPRALRLRADTVRYNGALITPTVSADGSRFSVTVPRLAAGATGLITYLTEVRPDARAGDVANIASARDDRGATSENAEAVTRIERDGISERFTLIGRVTESACTIDPREAKGISGVRVMLQDGTYTITDQEGRYHFEGLKPGTHVVQVDPSTFPLDMEPMDCAQNTRSAGSAISRFVDGRGGALKRADFRARQTTPRESTAIVGPARAPVSSDSEAAGAERDWFAGQTPGTRFIFPEEEHNPRSRAIRVAVLHMPGQTVELLLNGKPVNPLAFDGSRKSADKKMAVSLWRGIELDDRTNVLTARILNRGGNVIEELVRPVHYSASPIQARIVREKSVLVADGITRPVLAVRLLDRDGKPAHHGMTGDFALDAPYVPAVEVDAQQAQQLSGLERAKPVWKVEGDDGLAYIELAPTTASGTVGITFPFQDGQVSRSQRLEAWLDPGERPWTVVGFAEGTLGFNTLDHNLEKLTDSNDDVEVDGRIALYAKGRVSGKWLMTLAYDSDKREDETRFAGIIDPRSYYTIYADRSEQRYDAASVRRLYLRLERPQFYALFGDYETGINEPELARYQRAMNGIKAEYRSEQVGVTVFGADTPTRYRRDEIQGNGLTGPYALGARDVLLNSERITIEVRDRLRSDQIVETRSLTRHIDYDIDYLAGTLRFREPILSRDSAQNPQFIIAEYEVDGVGKREINAGGRVTWDNKAETVRVGVTAIHDQNDRGNTELGGVDIKVRPNATTELRAEMAISHNQASAGSATPSAGTAAAMLLEAEHHGSKFDALAYYRRQESGFGVGQQNGAENGTEKFGVDGRWRVTDQLSLALLGYQESMLATGARRIAGAGEVEYRKDAMTLRAGVKHADDRLSTGDTNRSTLVTMGGSIRLLDNKLELDAQTEFGLGGSESSVDFPNRHRFGARYAINDAVKIIGGYEITDGETHQSQTLRGGFELTPWAGGRVLATANRQDITEFGPRSYAAYGLAQSLRLSDAWSVDLSVDGNETFSGAINPADVLNPEHPVAAGGFLSSTGALTEDFIAFSVGATYRSKEWSWATRAEYRAADTGDRYGFTSAVLKQIGGGTTLGGLVSYFHATLDNGPTTDATSVELSYANRRDDSRWSFLDKLELREDKVRDAVAGQAGPIGGAALTVSGDVTSRRIINSLSINYTPIDEDDGLFLERGEYSVFWGTRYVFDKFGVDDVKGWSNVFGLDFKFDVESMLDIGGAGTVRIGTGARSIAYSGGPTVTFVPMENTNLMLGYNVVGFDDRDFEEARYTRDGVYVTFKLKFDQQSLGKMF